MTVKRDFAYNNLNKVHLLGFLILILLCGCALFPPGVYHRVQQGETLWRISRVYQVDLEEVAKINHLSDVTRIRTGQMLFIPGAKERKDTLASSEKPAPQQKIEGKEEPSPQILDFCWPLKGNITAGFGKQSGKRHQGLDIKAPEGTPVISIYDGIVTYSGDKLRGYGNMIIIKHNEDYSSVYAHNRINLVKEGEKVNKEQVIAEVGVTGWTEAPHLHFEIREKGKAVNPVFYLP